LYQFDGEFDGAETMRVKAKARRRLATIAVVLDFPGILCSN